MVILLRKGPLNVIWDSLGGFDWGDDEFALGGETEDEDAVLLDAVFLGFGVVPITEGKWDVVVACQGFLQFVFPHDVIDHAAMFGDVGVVEARCVWFAVEPYLDVHGLPYRHDVSDNRGQ